MRWRPEELAQAVGGQLVRRGSREVVGAFVDSREPVAGGLFVPIVAARDGHAFVPQAVAAGAAAVLVRRGCEVPEGDVTVVVVDDTLAAFGRAAAAVRDAVTGPVVAITGSNGKTTTRAFVEAVVKTGGYRVLATRGNLNNHLGVPLTLCNEPHDPDALVLELGMSAPGENDALGRICRPDVAVVTSVALEHVEFMKSLEAIAAAECETFAHLREGGAMVIPGDEPLLRPHVRRDRELLTFGAEGADTVRILEVVLGEGTRGVVALPDGTRHALELRPFGLHNARNAAAALAVAWRLGIAPQVAIAALAQVEPVGDRGKVLRVGAYRVVADCYNANPGSMEAALRSLAALREAGGAPLVAVLGDMLELGPDEATFHAQVGELAGALGIDAICGIGPLARHLVAAAASAGVATCHLDASDAAPTRAAAWVVERLEGAREGCVLVKASRGMRLERVVEALGQVTSGTSA